MTVGIDKRCDDITYQDIDAIVKAGQDEFTNLEFKSIFPQEKEQGKSELAKDLTAFANTDGGDIVYGVEKDNSNDATVPYKICGVERDAVEPFIRRMNQIARDRCYPPLITLEQPKMVDIPDKPNRCLVVVRVHPSVGGPHSSELTLPVYTRRTNANVRVNVKELREMMDAQQLLADRAHEWRRDRIRALQKGRLPSGFRMHFYSLRRTDVLTDLRPWTAGNQLFVIHLMPLSSFGRVPSIDTVTSWQKKTTSQPPIPLLFGDRKRLTGGLFPVRDGLFAYLPTSNQFSTASTSSYTMLFRSGALELASPNILARSQPFEIRSDLYARGGLTVDTLRDCLTLLEGLHIQPPILLGFHLSGVQQLGIPRIDQWPGEAKIGENEITSEEYRLDSFKQADMDALLGHFLDIVANAARQWKFNRDQAAS